MSKPEQKAWQKLKRVLDVVSGFECDRVENTAARNTPDVCFSYRVPEYRGGDGKGTHGWIELKAAEYPKDVYKKFTLPKFTAGQRSWLKTRGAIAGRCWLVIVTEATGKAPSYIIVVGWWQVDLVGECDWCTLVNKAWRVYAGEVDPESLAEGLAQ